VSRQFRISDALHRYRHVTAPLACVGGVAFGTLVTWKPTDRWVGTVAAVTLAGLVAAAKQASP
jgi:hypothetical protein